MNKQFILLFFASIFIETCFCSEFIFFKSTRISTPYMVAAIKHGDREEGQRVSELPDNLTEEKDKNGEFWIVRKDTTDIIE